MNFIKHHIEFTTKEAAHTEMPEDFMYNDFPCILTARDVPCNKVEATAQNSTFSIIGRSKWQLFRCLNKIKHWFFR